MQQIFRAIQQMIKKPSCVLIHLVTSVAFFAIFIAIPVWTIPGNSLAFQLSILRTRDYALMIFLAVLVGLHVAMHVYIWKARKQQERTPQSVVQGTASGVMGIFAAVIGTAACASCLFALFGLIGLGTGSVFFVLNNQPYFLIGTIALMLILLYFTARKVNRVCTSC